MAHGLNSMIKREIDCSSAAGIKSQVPQAAIVASSSVVNNSNSANSSGSGTGPCGNAKMGSRRIFTPQFKLQVLESYRNDSDCKGNQRATARKYGIHRRQIQKWLQCESNLRSSVANLSQTSMKHQFHNISHQMPIVPPSTHPGSHHHHHNHNQQQQHNHHQQQYKASVLSLDTARHSVALTPLTLAAPPTTTAAGPPAAAISAAARLTTKCVNGSNQSHHGTTAMRPAAVAVGTPAPAQQPPSYRVAVVPDATSAAAAAAAAALLTHTPALVPHYHHHHHHHQLESRLLMPSASLPVPGSPVSAATNRTDELRDYQPIGVTGNRYMNEDFRNSPLYEGFNYYGGTAAATATAPIDLSLGPRRRRVFDEPHVGGGSGVRLVRAAAMMTTTTTTTRTTAAMVLSSWQEVDPSDKNNNNSHRDDNYGEKKELTLLASPDSSSSHAVDLTCRKRKTDATGGADEEATPEKVQKTSNDNDHEQEDEDTEAGTVAGSGGKDGEHDDHHHHHHHHHQQQAKPVKLFKPYLLDENDQSKKSTKCEHDPIIWSHHPTCITPGGYDSQTSTTTTASNNNNINFPPSPNDRYPFPAGSPTFQSHRTATPSATPASPRAGATTYWCPKSSPVSGYDSASTYSDSSDYYRSPNHHLQAYSLDLKMQAIDSYYHDLTCRGDQIAVAGKYNVHKSEVQRWLDQETNIRQGIALYV